MAQRLLSGAGALACGAFALASAALIAAPGPSLAAERGHGAKTQVTPNAKPKPAAVVQDPLETSSFANATREDDAACLTARKKLWVEGEGWIVRRVTTCR